MSNVEKGFNLSPKVSIVILNWNNYVDTKECFESLDRVTYNNLEVVFVDNDSPDGSGDILHKEYPRHPYIQTGANLGFSGGCNFGIRYALEQGAKFIMLLNNDTIVDPGFIEPLVKAFEINKDIGITTGKAYYYDKPNLIHMCGGKLALLRATYNRYGTDEYDNGQYDISREVGFATAYFMLIKKDVFDFVPQLSEDYFGGVEEVEFNIEVNRAGFKVYYTHESKIWHKISRSFKPGTLRGLYATYRNKLILMKKMLSPFNFFIWKKSFYIYAVTIGLIRRVYKSKRLNTNGVSYLESLGVINSAFLDSKLKEKVSLQDWEKY
jgi:GT2 family glycosyltransferase